MRHLGFPWQQRQSSSSLSSFKSCRCQAEHRKPLGVENSPLLSAHQKIPSWILGLRWEDDKGHKALELGNTRGSFTLSHPVISSPEGLFLILSALGVRGAGGGGSERGISGHCLGLVQRQVVDGQMMMDAGSYLKVHESWASGHTHPFMLRHTQCMLVRTRDLLPQCPPWSACTQAL